MLQRKSKIILLILFTFAVYATLNFREYGHQLIQSKISEGFKNNGFNYILNPGSEYCGKNQGENLTLIALSFTRNDAFKNRLMIRSTWASKIMFPQLRAVFVLGTSTNKTLEKLIKEENDIYGDIVQEDYLDTYRNLTLKTISALKWVTKHCSGAKFVLKIDDDIMANPYPLLNYLSKADKKNDFQEDSFYCKPLIDGWVIRIKESRYYVSEEEWPHPLYPPYCQGMAYIMTVKLAGKLYYESFKHKKMVMEDVYIGILNQKINATFVDIWKNYYFDWYHAEEQENGWKSIEPFNFDDRFLVFLRSNDYYLDTLPVWNLLLKRYYELKFDYKFHITN